jgi:hypothetical protein
MVGKVVENIVYVVYDLVRARTAGINPVPWVLDPQNMNH